MENIGTLPLATINVAFNLPALYFVAALVLGISFQLGRKKYRQKRLDRALQSLSGAIGDYFRNLGIDVSASCFSVLGDQRFIAVIESEPIKKFRHSYIIEQSLVKYLARATGLQVEKIYWRFPFSATTEEAEEAPRAHPDLTDPYHAEGPAKAWVEGGYRVEDTSWESYEQARHAAHPGKDDTPGS